LLFMSGPYDADLEGPRGESPEEPANADAVHVGVLPRCRHDDERTRRVVADLCRDRAEEGALNRPAPPRFASGTVVHERLHRATPLLDQGTISSGRRRWCDSAWLVLPSSSSAKPPRPRCPVTTRSAFSVLAVRMIDRAGSPPRALLGTRPTPWRAEHTTVRSRFSSAPPGRPV
jgi:hypothetical protein